MVEHAHLRSQRVDGSLSDPAQAVIAKTASLVDALTWPRSNGDCPEGDALDGVSRRVAEILLSHVVIPLMDLLEEAFATDPEGVGPHYRTCLELASKEGLERFYPLGEVLDPLQHQVVRHLQGPYDQPRIVEVIRSGYLWQGKVLRPALVHCQGGRGVAEPTSRDASPL